MELGPLAPVPLATKYEPSVFALPKSRTCNYVPDYTLSDHEKWAQARQVYITSPDQLARDYAFELMLDQVTDANPPYAEEVAVPSGTRVMAGQRAEDMSRVIKYAVLVFLAFAIVGLCCLAVV